ncbi:hypothetical protein FALBO_15068 [Fusarium albosuccineum]|uniref:Uncharacterized protein n=1 Tax=Fusarium albosuccineum TaxID=1237068 RepID=A0A8H4PF23_9HYPO|nr:hypothetical protein FALBO_15068 [Fusarium albosuccineum]
MKLSIAALATVLAAGALANPFPQDLPDLPDVLEGLEPRAAVCKHAGKCGWFESGQFQQTSRASGLVLEM